MPAQKGGCAALIHPTFFAGNKFTLFCMLKAQRAASTVPQGGYMFRTLSALPPSHSRSSLAIQLTALFHEFRRLLFHAFGKRSLLIHAFLRREIAHVLGYLHRAEARAAHRAEVRDLAGFLGHGFVVKFARLVRVEAEVELVFPAEFEACLGQRVVAYLRAGMPLGEVGGMRGDLVGDDAFLHIVLVRQSQVLLW